MAGLGLLIKALRRGLFGPAERAGLLPTRHYVGLALDALEADDLDAAVRALEAARRRRDGGPRLALAREQVVFRVRMAARTHRAAADRADTRAAYLRARAREARRRVARRRAAPLVAAGTALAAALAAALLEAAPLALGAVAAILGAARLGGPVDADRAEATRLEAAAAAEGVLAGREREQATALGGVEARLLASRRPSGRTPRR